MTDAPRGVWLHCGQPNDKPCSCTGWNDVPQRPWHVPRDFTLTEQIAWINHHTGNTKPFRRSREWRKAEPKDD